jgi:hypothetical protein
MWSIIGIVTMLGPISILALRNVIRPRDVAPAE